MSSTVYYLLKNSFMSGIIQKKNILDSFYLFIYLLFIYLKIRTMYRGENNRTRSPLLGSPSYSDPIPSSSDPSAHLLICEIVNLHLAFAAYRKRD